MLLAFEVTEVLNGLIFDCCCSAALMRFSNNDFNEGDNALIEFIGATDALLIESLADVPLDAIIRNKKKMKG